MRITVSAITYRGAGGSPFSSAGALLEMGAPDFGAEILLNAHFSDVVNLLGHSLEEFKSVLAELPQVRIENNGQRIEIDYESKVCRGEDFMEVPEEMFWLPESAARMAEIEKRFGKIEKKDPCDAVLFGDFFCELVEVLDLLRTELDGVDGFDAGGFLRWATSRIEHVPKTNAELEQLNERAKEYFRTGGVQLDE